MSTTLIERLESIIATGEVSRSGLARAAGLHPNSLRKLGHSDWNPTADTLNRLEKLIHRGTDVLVGTEAIINEARNGRMFILVDDEGRENEGDLVVPAQMATPDAVNFVARLAGLNASAVICEIMRDDGSMARMDDLMDFARGHGLKIGTIRDLIAYRLKKDHLVERVATAPFQAHSDAEWHAQVFRDKASGEEQLALVHGALDTSKPVLVRMHSLDLFGDVLGEAGPRSGLLHGAMRAIEEEGSGVLVALHAAAPGSLSRSIDLRAGKPAEAGDAVRGYGTGAQILAALGIHDMILLTNTHHSPVALAGYGLAIVEERAIPVTDW